MIVEKQVITTEEVDIDIYEVTIPEVSDIEKLPHDLIKLEDGVSYWLKTPGKSRTDVPGEKVCFVHGGGRIDKRGESLLRRWTFHGCRPMIRFRTKSKTLKEGDIITAKKLKWIVTENGKAVCKTCISIGDSNYRRCTREGNAIYALNSRYAKTGKPIPISELNKWEDSDLKKNLDKWSVKTGLLAG